MQPPAGISLFWYRRVSELTLLLAALIVGFCAYNFLVDKNGSELAFVVPLFGGVVAGVAIICALVSRFSKNERLVYSLAMAGFFCLVIAAGSILLATDGIMSPFITLWMLLGIFAGLFSWYGLGFMFSLLSLYVIYLVMNQSTPATSSLVVLALGGVVPLVVSYLMWHHKITSPESKDKAYNELAHELTQVANTSDVVINAIADGVAALDAKGTIQLMNPAGKQILGWTGNDAIGLYYHSVFQLSDNTNKAVADAQNPIWQVFNTHQMVLNEDLTLTTRSGKQIMVSLLVSPAGDVGQGVIVVFRDITKQKQANREQAEFISTASHEMRTPVAAIEGYLGLAMNPQTATIDDKARLYLNKAHESAQHLGHLFQDLLDVSKADDGRLKNEPTLIDAGEFVNEVTQAFLPAAMAKNLTLTFAGGSQTDADNTTKQRLNPVYYAMADRDHLRELLNNLVENALKYTKEGGVTLDVGGDPEQIIISVKDTGIGIAPEDQPHLFQKFYRVDNTDTREIGGTGLGLYLCRRLAEAINGKIWVESEFQKGATFFLSLPRLNQEEVQAAKEQVAKPQTTPVTTPQEPTNVQKT